ncbi:peptidoglycan-associated lipoprotein Pal [Lyticum sinuosum]|uniref:Peptidoglycan-associated protein n=1 Tax=Lyticum sinuosum TaxID=1332059 RepID=A0AAE4VMG7_9RICK|nr:peptidoglycan-associated lipoprotein Pal [Lyticum sinuosum]MDZ5761623.1 OmpA family Peptidoglycan-associated lipoprotein [Lyticum sinuosum]
MICYSQNNLAYIILFYKQNMEFLRIRNLLLSVCAGTLLTACSCGNRISTDNTSSGITSGVSDLDDVPAGLVGINDQMRKTAGDRIFFKLNKSNITAEAQSVLNKQVEFIKQNQNLQFVIEGHCDERGTREYNMALGERRANAVKNYLISKGIDSSRLSVVSFGKEKPADEGHNEEAWEHNRRSVTIIVSAR